MHQFDGGATVFADTQAMKVSAKRVSSYSVTIPSTLSLTTTDKQNFTGTYTVGVKGDVDANDSVYLRPQNASFEMVGKADSNNKSTASVTQTKTEWSGGEIDNSSFTETTGDVEAEITHADEYEGNLVFEYGIDTLYCEHNYEDNVCTKCGKEASVGYLYASDGSVIKQFTEADVMEYGSISHLEGSLEEPIVISLPKYLGLSDDQIDIITKIVMPEMTAPADCSFMFYICQYVQEIDFTGFDVSNVTDMSRMFFFAGSEATTFNIDLSQWDVGNVTDMTQMFQGAGYTATTWSIGDLSQWNVSNVTDMYGMFDSAGHDATTWSIGDLSQWSVGNVTNMSNMFSDAGYNATTFDIGDLSSWDVGNVTNMYGMFESAGFNATTFNIGNLSQWDVSNVTDMSDMFSYAGYTATTWSIGDLSQWNVYNVIFHSDFNQGVEFKITPPTWKN